MPSMERLYQEIGEDGFEIMAVSIDAELGRFDLPAVLEVTFRSSPTRSG